MADYSIIFIFYRSSSFLSMTYFSNHSQSRFPATSNTTNNSSSSNMSTNATSQAAPARPRVPPSRHFSTSVSTGSSGDEKPSTKEKHTGNGGSNGLDPETLHPLRNTCVLSPTKCFGDAASECPAYKIDGSSGSVSSVRRETK